MNSQDLSARLQQLDEAYDRGQPLVPDSDYDALKSQWRAAKTSPRMQNK